MSVFRNVKKLLVRYLFYRVFIRGGGIYNSGILTLTNSTVSGNFALSYNYYYGYTSSRGGGIYNDGTVTLYSSLISGNTTDGMMGSGNEVNSTGSIIADSFNLFGHSGETSAEAFNFSPGSNDVTATSDGTKPTALSDILASLADNDGPTKTHALVQDSPAIDLDAICSTSPDTDQRGYPRPEAEGTGCDAGAFEGSIILPHSILPAVYLLLLQ